MKRTFTAALVAQLMVTTAWAQGAAPVDDGTTRTQEIIVTAQKREERLQDVPISVAVVGQAQIENSGISDMTQLNTIIPGLNIQHSVGSFQPAIRGVTTSTNFVENPVALYIDGVYMPNQRDGLRDLADIEQIAVLKGPQGTLFGRNATAGVIQITTKRPSHTPEAEIKVGYDNYQTFRGSAFVTGGLSDKVAASISATYSTQGKGWGESLADGRDVYKLKDHLNLRGKLLVEASDRTEITLIGDYMFREDTGREYQPYPGTTYAYPGFGPVDSRYDTYSGTPSWNRFRSRGVSLEIDHEFDFANLVSITSFRRGTGGFRFDFTGVPTPFVISTGDLRNKDFTQEIQLISPDDQAFRWVAGVFYIYNEIEYADFPRVVTHPFPPLAVVSRIDGAAIEKTDSIAPFFQADFDLTETTTLTLGGRWTYEKREIEGSNFLTLVSGAVIPQPAVVPSTLTTKKPTWRIALNQKLNPDVSAYVSYNRGIKSGGFNISTPSAPAYDQETLDAFELGLKSEMLGGMLTVNTSAFLYKYKNLQVLTFIGSPTPIVTNGAKAEMYGLDADIRFKASDQLTLSGGFQWMHTEFTDYGKSCVPATGVGCAPISSPNPAGGSITVFGDVSGNRLPLAQEFVGTIALDYDQPIGDWNLHFNATATYNGNYYFAPDNFVLQPSYWMLNASIKFTDPSDRFSLTGAVTNILNESIITSLNTVPYGIYVSYGAAPRIYSLTAGFRF